MLKGIDKKEKGILMQTVEDLLNLIQISYENKLVSQNIKKKLNEERCQLIASVYCIYQNEIFDLLSKQKIKVFKKIKNSYDILV